MITVDDVYDGRNASFQTTGRESFIRLFSSIAMAIDPTFLHSRDNIPVISIHGGHSIGKSLAVEAMMRTLIDDGNLDDVSVKEADRMFLESKPCHAARKSGGVSEIFNVAGKRTKMVFGSNGLQELLNDKAVESIALEPSIEGGVIFSSDMSHHSCRHKKWIKASIFNNYAATHWYRDIYLHVEEDRLWQSPRLQTFWQFLSEQVGKDALETLSPGVS